MDTKRSASGPVEYIVLGRPNRRVQTSGWASNEVVFQDISIRSVIDDRQSATYFARFVPCVCSDAAVFI